MKVILASPRGFCAGVNMAVECLDQVLSFKGAPIYVFHEIVHNKYVVDRFRERGAVFVESVADVPENSILLYSAHGVSPQVREFARSRRLRTIDATCPLVTKVHVEALKFAKEGYQIVLIGHHGHDEVIGTMGEAPDFITLVETPEDVGKLSYSGDLKLAYLTQTTLSVDEANIVIRALKARYPHIVGPKKDDICYATQNRQEAVHAFTPEVEVVLVVGSQNSSNSKRLQEIATSYRRPSYLVDGPENLKKEWFGGIDTVLVTAGASAPEDVVQSVLAYLKENFGATVESKVMREEHVEFALPKELRELRKDSTLNAN